MEDKKTKTDIEQKKSIGFTGLKHKKGTTAEVLKEVVRRRDTDFLTVHEIKYILNDKGFVWFILLFTLPVLIPLPYPPGLTTILIFPVIILSLQMIFGRKTVWLPRFMNALKVKRVTARILVSKSLPIITKLESFISMRFFWFHSDVGQRVFAIMIFIFSLAVAVPMPLTNLLPAIAIVIMSLGFMGRDGVVILCGIFVGIIGVIIMMMVLKSGISIVMHMWDRFF